MWIRNHWDHFLDPQVRDDLHQFDVVLGNLETPVDESSSVPSLLPDAATYNARPGLVDSFSKNGKSPFTVLTFANNHTFDRGDTGALKTQQFLESRNIRIAGIAPARQKPDQDPVITWIEAKGARIGLYSATWGVNDDDQLASTSMHVEILPGFRADESSKPLDVRRALRALEIMKQQGADFRILYLHWGHEYELHPTVKQMRAARALAQGGADLILGAHSHNAQPPEICQVNETRPSDLPCQLSDPANPTRRESWIFYGLGNFTTSLFGVPAQLAMLTDLTIRKKPDRTWEVRQANAQFYYNEHSLFRESDTRLIPYQTRWNALSEIERASEKTTIDQIRAIIGLREFRPNQ